MKELYYNTEFGKVYLTSFDFSKDETIIWLHGWGSNGSTFYQLVNKIKDYNHLIIDFLGFGKSDEPNKELILDDYVTILYNIITDYNLKNVVLIGHSFGGRVAIKYSSLYNVNKTFLVSAKAFKNKSIKKKVEILKYKIKKRVLYFINKEKYNYLIKNSGSIDYKNASCIMKGILKNVVNYDLTNDLRKIKNEVIICASVNDLEVKYQESLKIYRLLTNSKIYPFYRSNHFLYFEEKDKFLKVLLKELN